MVYNLVISVNINIESCSVKKIRNIMWNSYCLEIILQTYWYYNSCRYLSNFLLSCYVLLTVFCTDCSSELRCYIPTHHDTSCMICFWSNLKFVSSLNSCSIDIGVLFSLISLTILCITIFGCQQMSRKLLSIGRLH